MNEIVIMTEDMKQDDEYFGCPLCKCDVIHITFKYCPHCGVELSWNLESEKIEKLKRAVEVLNNFEIAFLELGFLWSGTVNLDEWECTENYPEHWESFDSEMKGAIDFVRATVNNLNKKLIILQKND